MPSMTDQPSSKEERQTSRCTKISEASGVAKKPDINPKDPFTKQRYARPTFTCRYKYRINVKILHIES